jgi:cysteine desulfurase
MIYADFNGSSLPLPEVIEHLTNRLQKGPFGNPNAIHSLGQKLNAGLSKCRRHCSKVLGCEANQIVFNSGASEGISHVFFSVLNKKKIEKKHIIISSIEHSAVINAAKYYEDYGYTLHYLGVDGNGVVKIDELKSLLEKHKDDVALVSVMAANNETGVIQPYREIGQLCHENNTLFFSDTTQYIGKTVFNFAEANMDFAVLSGHKIGGIVGSGLVIVKNPADFHCHVFGGGQENGHRGGTQNYIGIETLAVALNSFDENKQRLNSCYEKRIDFEARLKKAFPDVVIIGDKAARLASTTLVSYPGIHGQGVQIELESQDIFVTTSSACSDNEPTTSKVLKAMNISDDIGRGVVRISLCLGQNEDAYDKIFEAISNAYKKLVKIKNY